MSQPPTKAEIAAAIAQHAQQEHARTQARLRTGRENRARTDGRGSGPLPYGYRRGPWNQVEIDPDHAQIILAMVQHMNVQRLSYAATANELNQAGFRTSLGQEWTASSVQQVMRHMLLYTTGIREWGNETAVERWPIIVPIQPQIVITPHARQRKPATPSAGSAVSPTNPTNPTNTPASPSTSYQPPYPAYNAPAPLGTPEHETTTEHIYLPPGAEDLPPGDDQ